MQKLYQFFKQKFERQNQTDKDQLQVQNKILEIFSQIEGIDEFHILEKDDHYQYQYGFLQNVSVFSQAFDNGQSWIIYWTLNSLQMLKQQKDILNEQQKDELVEVLKLMQVDGGLFKGGQYQILHLASCYAAMCSIILIGTEKAYKLLGNKQKIKEQLISLKNPNQKGAYLMHQGGESDMRAIYIVICICRILGLDKDIEIVDNMSNYIQQCQTYEGGFGSEIGMEAHGGYSILALSSMVILDSVQNINVDKLVYWLSHRQCQIEGGFNGRTNKLVDSCYSYWQAASFKILMDYDSKHSYQGRQLYDQQQLQKYILLCCQQDNGGLRDKPGKKADLYHTCYALSGLSLSQQTLDGSQVFYGSRKSNQINQIDPIFNVDQQLLKQAMDFYNS